MRTTIKDIAKYTGFSITTISLVLNGKAHKIPKATEEAILQAAKELNYRPNQLAVGLVKKQTKTLGLILSDIRNSFFANMAKSIEDECRRNGWNLILDVYKRQTFRCFTISMLDLSREQSILILTLPFFSLTQEHGLTLLRARS